MNGIRLGAVLLGLVIAAVRVDVTLAATPWINNGPFSGIVNVVVSHPSNPDTVYAVTEQQRFVRSFDGGATWDEPHPEPKDISGLCVDDTGGAVFTIQWGSVIVSHDDGSTWSESFSGSSPAQGLAVAYSRFGRGVFAWTSRELAVTWDGGFSWGLLSDDITPVLGDGIEELHSFPASPDVLLAWASDTLLRSDDGGATWQDLGVPLWKYRSDLETGVAIEEPMYRVRQYRLIDRSLDGGLTWNGVTAPGQRGRLSLLGIPPSRPLEVWANVNLEGLVRSTDGGMNWEWIRQEHGRENVHAVAFSSLDPDAAFLGGAVSPSGVNRSLDGGQTWQGASIQGPPIAPMQLVPDPRNDNVIYAASFFDGVHVTRNRGQSWALVPGTALLGNHICIDPGDSDHMITESASAFWQTFDGGGTWTRVGGLSPGTVFYERRCFTNPHEPGILVRDIDGVWRTTDRGVSWVPAFPVGPMPYTDYAFSPPDPDLIIATGYGVARSEDGGRTWSTVLGKGPGDPDGSETLSIDVAFDPSNPDRIIFLGRHSGRASSLDPGVIYLSEDRGSNWLQIDDFGLDLDCDFFVCTKLEAVAIDPRFPGRINLVTSGTYYGGLFELLPGGTSWQRIPAGSVKGGRDLLFSDDGSSMLWAVEAGGVLVRHRDTHRHPGRRTGYGSRRTSRSMPRSSR